MRNIFSTLILLCCSISLASATPLTLQQCIERGLELNPQVQANRLAVDEATEGIYEAWGEFLPTVSVNYAYTDLNDSANRTVDRDYLSQTSDSFTVRLTQPVFSGMANISGLNKARQIEDYRGYELALKKMQLVMGIRTSFYELLRAQQLVEKWGELIGRLKDQRKSPRPGLTRKW